MTSWLENWASNFLSGVLVNRSRYFARWGGKEVSQLVVKDFLVVDFKELGQLLWFGVTEEHDNPVKGKGHGGLSSDRFHRP
jgi:hypothetical protein